MKCSTPSGRHRWKERLPESSVFRSWNFRLQKDARLRICAHCGNLAHIDGQGRTVEDDPAGEIPSSL